MSPRQKKCHQSDYEFKLKLHHHPRGTRCKAHVSFVSGRDVQAIFGPPPPPADKATDRRYAADLGPANMFNRHFGGRPSIAFTRHM